ncbi:MAG: carboxypeptidase-like regulatory domain-containing protein [archaeon]|jgi:hypothetical protein
MQKKLLIGIGIILIIIIISFLFIIPNFNQPNLATKNTFSGSIRTLTGELINNVQVTTISNSTTSNEQGLFQISGKPGNAIITFEKNGYVPLHKSVIFNESKNLDIIMYEEEKFVEVDITTNINVEIKGAGLKTEPNSFILPSGELAQDAQISLTPFNPSIEKDLEAFPGEFQGERMDGTNSSIETFGFVKVQVENKNGDKLDLLNGKTAQLKIPISSDQIESSPETIPLWYFDTKKETWVERGIAQKICNENNCYYEGQIDTIASWWNCDQPMSTSNVNCDESNESNGPGTVKELVKEVGTDAAKWLGKKLIGEIPVAGTAYSIYNAISNSIKEFKNATPDSKLSSAAQSIATWGAKKVLGKIPGLGTIISVADLVKTTLDHVQKYLENKLNAMFNLNCVAVGKNYSSKTQTQYTPSYPSKQIPFGELPVIYDNSSSQNYRTNNSTSLPVRSDSIAEIKYEAYDMVSEGIIIQTSPAGEIKSINQDFASVSVPLEIDTSGIGNGAYSPIVVSFTNKDGNEIYLTKTLSSTDPLAYLTFLIKPGREGTIKIKNFKGQEINQIEIPSLEIGERYQTPEQLINPIIKPKIESTELSDFNCNEHYMYVTKTISEDSKTFNILYYDGKEIDRGKIESIFLFGDNIAYEKTLYYTLAGEYCGDFSYYDSKNSCTYGKSHVIYNNKDLGEGSGIALWGDHIMFQNYVKNDSGDLKHNLFYDGKIIDSQKENESSLYYTYYLWGDNYAYKREVYSEEKIYWNGVEIAQKGDISGIHKDFLLLFLPSSEEFHYALFKDGKLISNPDGSSQIGVFGDHWWEIKEYKKIYYDGELIFEGQNPKIIIFDDKILYGDACPSNYCENDEAYYNGVPIKLGSINGSLYRSKLFEDNILISGNKGIYFNGIFNTDCESNCWDNTVLYGNNWLGTKSQDNSFNWSGEGTAYLNGELIPGKTSVIDGDSRIILFNNNYAYQSEESTKDSGYNYSLIYNGKIIGETGLNDFVLTPNHIIFTKSYKDYQGNGYTKEYLIDGKTIGFDNIKINGEEIIYFNAWPIRNPSRSDYGGDIGTNYSNNHDISNKPNYFGTLDFPFDYSGSFTDEWLYCTGKWK